MASKGKRNGSAAPSSEEPKTKVGRGAPRGGDRPGSGGPGAGRGRGKSSSKDPNWIEIDDKKERAEFDNLRDQMTAVAEKYEKIEQAIKARNTEADGWKKERGDLRAQIKQTSQRLRQLLETKKQLRSQFQAANVEVRDIMEHVHAVKKKLPVRRLESEKAERSAGASSTTATEAAPATATAAAPAPATTNAAKKSKKGNAAPAAPETAPAAGGKKKKKQEAVAEEVTEPEGATKRRPGRKEKVAEASTAAEPAEGEGDGKPKKTPEEREADMRAKRERNFLLFQANMQYLDENIKEMEHKLSTTSLSLADEKKTVREIQRLGSLRREVAAVFDRLSKFRESDVKTVIFAEQREKDEEFSALQDEIDTLRDKEKTIDTRINDVYQTVLPELRTKRDALGFEYEDLRKKKDEAWAAMQAVKDKFRDQIKAKQEQARVEREKERTERQERRRKYEDDKRVKEEKKVPYEDELELCDRLVQYLKPFLPKEEKKETTTPASAEGGAAAAAAAAGSGADRNKRRQQKSANENIKHQWDMFSLFEQLSLLPPTKVGEVEQSVTDIRAKRENYLKLQKEEIERRQKEREEKERQDKERKEKEAAEAAAAAAAAATAATTATTSEASTATTTGATTEGAETTSAATEEKTETKPEEAATTTTPAVEEPKAEESH